MDDERIHCDAHAAIDFLDATLVDLDSPEPNIVLVVRGARLQAICFLANYFSRANAPLIAAATAGNVDVHL
jgi:hypothetical protein